MLLTRGARRVAFFHGTQALVILCCEIAHKNFWLLDLRTGARHMLCVVLQGCDDKEDAQGGSLAASCGPTWETLQFKFQKWQSIVGGEPR